RASEAWGPIAVHAARGNPQAVDVPASMLHDAALRRERLMNVRLVHEFRFEAAHRLPRVPPGHKCERLHGHSFKVEIAIRGPVAEETGWFIDYGVLYKAWEPLHAVLDHNFLNEVPGLENPTSEILARWIWQQLKPVLPQLSEIVVHETCTSASRYKGA